MNDTGVIYSLNCPITGTPKYIGQTIRLPRERLASHLMVYKNNKRNSWIKGLLLKGTKPVMEIIDEVPISEISFWEMHYISLYKSWGFDLKNGTHGGEYGGRPTVDTRLKLRLAKLGTKQTPETIAKRSASLKGNKNGVGYKKTEAQKLNSIANRKKFKHTEESKLKMSLSSKGKPKSDAHKLSLRKPKNKK